MSKDEKIDLFDEINDQISNYYSSYGSALYNASRQRSFGYGESQWTEETKDVLRRLKLPPLKQNIITKHIKSAVAEFSSNIPTLEVAAMSADTSPLKVKTYDGIIHGDIMKNGKGSAAIVSNYEEILRTGMAAGMYVKTEYINNGID